MDFIYTQPMIFLLLALNMCFAQTNLQLRLLETRAENMMEVIDQLDLVRERLGVRRMLTSNPYGYENLVNDHQLVCAVKFLDSKKIKYKLQTFESTSKALAAGHIPTHYNHCGACSTLKDLAIYMAKPDLTTVGRQCSKKLTIKHIKNCYKENAGFTDLCAEAWAYNSRNTRKECLLTCIKDYGGLLNAMRGETGSQVDNLSNGELRPCVQCDEVKSGPGFKYAAGRTRRNSGLNSSIIRQNDEVMSIDNSLYFNEK